MTLNVQKHHILKTNILELSWRIFQEKSNPYANWLNSHIWQCHSWQVPINRAFVMFFFFYEHDFNYHVFKIMSFEFRVFYAY